MAQWAPSLAQREAASPSEGATDLVSVVRGIRRRARFARISGLAVVVILTVIGVGTAYIFLVASAGVPVITIGGSAEGSSITVKTTGGPLEWVSELTRSFIRIASVIMAVFIVNILVSFARYDLRVANFLDARADCLIITLGNIEKFAVLLPSISVDPLDFGKTPMSPFDTYLATIRGIMPGRFQSADRGEGHKAEHERSPEQERPVQKS